MRITKIFLTVYSEKKWLEKQAESGYELIKRDGFTYIFEKTDKKVCYGYVFLKNGKKSFQALDYKKKDGKAVAVYGNGYVALFYRLGEEPCILPRDKLRSNYLMHKQRRTTGYLCYFMASLIVAMVARYLWPLWLLCAVFLSSGFCYLADVRATDKMIKEL